MVKAKGWRVVHVYKDVQTSFRDRERPDFDRMKADLEAGRIDAIMFWKLDRLARRVRDVSDMLDLLKSKRAVMASVTEGLDTTTELGRGMVLMLGVMAQIASAETAERVKGQKLTHAMSGGDPGGGSLPFGWTVEEVERTVDDQTIKVKVSTGKVDPAQAEGLREAAHLFLAELKGLGPLATMLSDRGFRTHRTKFTNPRTKQVTDYEEGRRITAHTLRGILSNPRLAGYRAHWPTERRLNRHDGSPRIVDLYRGEWEPIIDNTTFLALQKRFENEVVLDPKTKEPRQLILKPPMDKRRGQTPRTTTQHLLTGRIWCGKCPNGSERMRWQPHAEGDRYKCASCSSVTIDADLLEQHVTKLALDELMGPRWMSTTPAMDIGKLERDLKKHQEALEEAAVARYVDQRMNDAQYDKVTAQLATKIEDLQEELLKARDMQVSPIPGNLAVLGFEGWWVTANLAERQRVIAAAVERIVVDPYTELNTKFLRREGVQFNPNGFALKGIALASWPLASLGRVNIVWRANPAMEDTGRTTASSPVPDFPASAVPSRPDGWARKLIPEPTAEQLAAAKKADAKATAAAAKAERLAQRSGSSPKR